MRQVGFHQRRYYQPVQRGLEIKLAEKRERLDSLDANSPKKRY